MRALQAELVNHSKTVAKMAGWFISQLMMAAPRLSALTNDAATA